MSWVTQFFHRRWRNIQLGLVLALALGLILGPAEVRGLVSEVVLRSLYYPFHRIKQGFVDATIRATDLSRLQAQLVKVTEKLSLYEEASREIVRLRAALGFEPPPGYELTPAKVVKVSGLGAHLPTAAAINRGLEDAIKVDLPLINQDGLIGRVVSVSVSTATIQLLTDPSNRVAARLARSREMGIVRHVIGVGMVLDNVPVQADIRIGDTVLSSGLGGIYPAGLLVGTVVEVIRPEEEPFCSVRLNPAADVRKLEELFVLHIREQ